MHADLELRSSLGDTKTFHIPLRWGKRPFAPEGDWGLTFTAKKDPDTPDADALLQKATGAGIEVNGTTALVTIQRVDTYREADEIELGSNAFQADPGTYYCDIQAQNTDTGEVRTIWDGTLTLVRDITQRTTTSVPIYTTQPPYPGGGGVSSWNDLEDIPDTFNPSSHAHPQSDVIGLPDALSAIETDITAAEANISTINTTLANKMDRWDDIESIIPTSEDKIGLIRHVDGAVRGMSVGDLLVFLTNQLQSVFLPIPPASDVPSDVFLTFDSNEPIVAFGTGDYLIQYTA